MLDNLGFSRYWPTFYLVKGSWTGQKWLAYDRWGQKEKITPHMLCQKPKQ